jgi:hypothetical protein
LSTTHPKHAEHGLDAQPNANMKVPRPLDSLSTKSPHNHQVINSVDSKIFHNPHIINNNKIPHDPFQQEESSHLALHEYCSGSVDGIDFHAERRASTAATTSLEGL